VHNIQRILLPLDLAETTLPTAAIHEAVGLAQHFHSEIILLHVVKPFTYVGTSQTTRQLLEQSMIREQEKLNDCLGPNLNGISIRRLVLKGDPAHEIVRTAHDEKIDLIVMPTHGYGPLQRFLLGSVTMKVLHNGECPVWTGAQVKDGADQSFTIRKVLCAVDFGPNSAKTIQRAQELATEFGAKLTLAHVTPGVEIYGPGGYHVLEEMKTELVGSATRKLEKLKQELGSDAAIFIGSGDIPKIMRQAAEETKADVIVVGSRSIGGRVGNTAYGIIRESPVPVLSV
jgi:nucleotide-binding universal stress UspA family protein